MDDIDDEAPPPWMVNRGTQTPLTDLYPVFGDAPAARPARASPASVETRDDSLGGDRSVDDTEEEVNMDGSSFHSARSSLTRPVDVEGRPRGRVKWMPPGHMERLGVLAYATVSDGAPAAAPAHFIRAALMEAAERVHFRMHASSRGHMLL